MDPPDRTHRVPRGRPTFYLAFGANDPMTIEPHRYPVRLAVIERHLPDVVHIRYREGIAFDTEGIAEVIATCERVALKAWFGVISILPADGEMSLAAMQQDHSTPGFADRVRAHALVTSGGLFRSLTEIHYNYHPQTHEVRLFISEAEALTWVQAQLADRSVA